MIDIIHKIHIDEHDPHSLFAEVTVDSIANHALHIGYQTPNQKIVVYREEIDQLIDTLQLLKTKYI